MRSTSEASEDKQSDHPYDQFLAGQKKREVEWKSNREAKKAQSTTPTITSAVNRLQEDPAVTLLRQQLTAKTEECRRLIDRLDAIEEVNAKILRSQTQMQENFVKVILFLKVVVIVATCDQALITNLHHS